jgi:hypothetical protein
MKGNGASEPRNGNGNSNGRNNRRRNRAAGKQNLPDPAVS